METYATALVLGLAASGEAAARLLLAEGTQVSVVDRADGDVLRQRAAALDALGARVALGQSGLPAGSFSVCVVSPGIPVNSPWVNDMRQRGVPVLAELELGWSRAACRILAISGSNGKSTLVRLCADALAGAGQRVTVAGNYGIPVSQAVLERRDWDWLVLEVSSFQLETVRAFRPDVGVLLNLHPNHLDRHGTMAAYEQLKTRLFSRMRAEDVGVVPEALASRIAGLAGSPNRWVTFGTSADAGVRYHEGRVIDRLRSRRLSLEATAFANDILGVAGAAAAAAIGACGESLETLERAARAFQPLPHRMQEVAARGSIRFVDDSKATNLAAMMAALKMSPAPVRLIAGGLPKHESYDAARPLLADKVAAVYLIGEAADTMASAWQDVVPCRLSRTLEEAVRSAGLQARPGDTVLLSPACASFDQFKNFEDRGDRFAQCVRTLGEGSQIKKNT